MFNFLGYTILDKDTSSLISTYLNEREKLIEQYNKNFNSLQSVLQEKLQTQHQLTQVEEELKQLIKENESLKSKYNFYKEIELNSTREEFKTSIEVHLEDLVGLTTDTLNLINKVFKSVQYDVLNKSNKSNITSSELSYRGGSIDIINEILSKLVQLKKIRDQNKDKI